MRSPEFSFASAGLVLLSYLFNIAAASQLFVPISDPDSVPRMAVGFHAWLIVVAAIAIWHPRKLLWISPQLITGAAMADILYWLNFLCPIVAPDFLEPSPGCIVSSG